ncbi:MAG TPA: putative quinol monooxygenase [Solirubrobacteraceae bacterium]|jgi:quinol monooxygenase YgiN
MVIVIARVTPRPDRQDELLALLEEVQEASRRDDGCLNYGYYQEIVDRTKYVAVEEWRDEEALAAHLRQPHVAKLIAALGDSLAAPPEIAAHHVERSGPLPLPQR